MGSRANLVIVKNRGFSLYFCHWCARTLPGALFWGPAYVRSYIEQQSEEDKEHWLDTIWAEGGVVLDEDRQLLLLYGGEELLVNIPLRRLYLQLMRLNWPGWELRWAGQGILDMAHYVGVPLALVTGEDTDEKQAAVMRMPTDEARINWMGTVRFADKTVWIYPLAGFAQVWYFLKRGEDLLDMAGRERQIQAYDMTEWSDRFPSGGFHIDVPAQSITYWQARDLSKHREIQSKWPNWQLNFVGDRFEVQRELAEGNLIFPKVDSAKLLQELKGILLPGVEPDPSESLRRIVEEKEEVGWEMSVAPTAWHHAPLKISLEAKKRIWARAILSLAEA
ncbi:MAG: hypothetical protein KDE28_26930 [Anaerolineales bacterium]|nr:hypothetical protein [Anaerolineales bacterium]